MSEQPDGYEYRPPKGGEREEPIPIDLGDGHEIVVQAYVYNRMYVDYAIMHMYTGDGIAAEVFRVDCKHGEIHYHQLDRLGRTVQREVLLRIPKEDCWRTVHNYYEQAYDLIADHMDEHFRVWRYS